MKRAFGNYHRIDAGASQQLNTLRGLSAIAVLVGHCVQTFVAPIYPPALAYFGLLAQAAVMLFFVLSGLLITKSITRNASQPNGFNVATFAADRFDRIYPPFLLAMLLVVVILLVTPHLFPTGTNLFAYSGGLIVRRGFEVEFRDWLGGLVFFNGFAVHTISADGPLWSLSDEVWYYVAAGVLAWKPRIGAMIVLPLMLGLGFLNKPFLVYSLVWFSGALVAVLHNYQIRRARFALALLSTVGAAALLVGAYYVYKASRVTTAEADPARVMVAFNVLWGLSCAAAVYLVMIGALRFRPIMQGSAKFSYTLYVTHFPLVLVIYGTAQSRILGNPLLSLCTAAFAFLSALGFARLVAPTIEHVKLAGQFMNGQAADRGTAVAPAERD